MKVLHVTNLFPTSESPDYGVFVKEQIDSIKAIEGLTVDLHHIDVNAGGRLRYLRAIFEVYSKAREYDIIHAHHIFSGFVCIFSALRSRVVVSFLSDRYDVEPRLAFIGPLLFGLVCLLTSKQVTKVKRDGLFGRKMSHLPNGVDQQLFKYRPKKEARAKLGIDDDACMLLFVSSKTLTRTEKRKDVFDELIQQMRARFPELKILPYYMSNVDRTVVPMLFNAADVHVLTSDFEGSPNSVKEALHCGCPVAATDVGDVRNLLDGVPHTKLMRQEDVFKSELCDFIRECSLIDEAEQMQIVRRMKMKKLSKEDVAERLVELYREVL